MTTKDTAKDSDVLDFINSLPDSKPSTPKPTSSSSNTTATNNTNTKGGADKEDLFDFLDELAEHEKKQNKVLSPKVTTTNNNKKVDSSNEDDPTTGTTTDKSDTTNEDIELHQQEGDDDDGDEEDNDLELPNPISSITSWWNLEGSTKVNSIWKNITTNAEKISEQTYKIANETTNQLNTKSKNINSEEITHTLNNLFINISNQIKQGLIEENDEVLNILIVCDLFNLRYLKLLVYNNFDMVMRQVEGSIRTSVNELSNQHVAKDEENRDKVQLNMFYGKLIDGEKLCLANLENGIKDYKNLKSKHEQKIEEKEEQEDKEQEQEQEQEKESAKEEAEEEISQSNIFISIQPVTTKIEGEESKGKSNDDKTIIIEGNNDNSFSFVIILKDISNDITIVTRSQPMPLRWAQWLDGEKLKLLEQQEAEKVEEEQESIDPKEWVKDWIRQSLNLSIGVLAQEYVIKRMGV